MNSRLWQRAKELFADALELPEDDRAAFLDDACNDPELRTHVEQLLGWDRDAGAEVLEAGVPVDLIRIGEGDNG